MAQNYTRQSSFNDGDTISASLFNDEYNQLVNAFTYSGSSDSSTGHRHDGSSGQGGNIYRIGDLDFFNKIEADSINNRWGFYVEVGGAAVEQVRIQDGAVVPVTDNDVDLGSVSLEFKDLYLDGTANIDSLVADTADINGGTVDGVVIGATTAAAITGTTLKANTSLELATGATVTAILDEDTLSSDSDTALATQQSIKAYVDAQVTAQDLDVTTDSGTIAIDLDSEVFTVAGGTGLNTSATGNTVTVAIDSTVATLTGTQTLTNKTLTSPDINGGTIDGGTIDGVTIGGSSAGAITGTTGQFNTSLNVDGAVTADGADLDGAVVINESGADVDFRVESDTNANAFFLDGATGNVGIGKSPAYPLDIQNPSFTQNFIVSPASGVTFIGNQTTDSALSFLYGTGKEAMRIDGSGNVGIGTSSPVMKLEAYDGVDTTFTNLPANLRLANNGTIAAGLGAGINFSVNYDNTNTTTYAIISGIRENATVSNAAGALVFGTRDSGGGVSIERMRIDSSGNVGIGTSSPAVKLDVVASAGTRQSQSAFTSLIVQRNATEDLTAGINIIGGATSGQSRIDFSDSDANAIGSLIYSHDSNYLRFDANSAERMRIDSSGNLLVGTTDANVSDNSGASNGGINIQTSGVKGVISAAAAQTVTYLNRLGSDGDIAIFRKDGSTVGSIGTETSNSDLYIGNGDTAIMFHDGVDSIFPHNASTNASRDAAIDIGYSTYRFKDLYLSGGLPGTAAGSLVINENGVDSDFRVESDSNTHALFVDAGQDSVKIGGTSDVGTGSYRAELAVNGTYGQAYGSTATFMVTVDMPGGTTVTLGTYTADAGGAASAHLSGHHHFATLGSTIMVYQKMAATRVNGGGTTYTDVDNVTIAVANTNSGATEPTLFWDNGALKVTTAANQGCYAEIKVVFQTNYNGVWTPSY